MRSSVRKRQRGPLLQSELAARPENPRGTKDLALPPVFARDVRQQNGPANEERVGGCEGASRTLTYSQPKEPLLLREGAKDARRVRTSYLLTNEKEKVLCSTMNEGLGPFFPRRIFASSSDIPGGARKGKKLIEAGSYEDRRVTR